MIKNLQSKINRLLFICIIGFLVSCSPNTKPIEKEDNAKVEHNNMSNISNPISLEYEFIRTAKAEDGTAISIYIQKGVDTLKKTSGDYFWLKSVPFYASETFQYVFEYQMDFKESDLDNINSWLKDVMGSKIEQKSIDNPFWYNDKMTITEIFNYCKSNNEKITIALLAREKGYLTHIVFDTGSAITKTSPEIAIVFFVLQKP